MKPPQANMAVLGALVAVAVLIFNFVGPGIWFNIAVWIIGIGWCAQFTVLGLAARRGLEPPAFTSFLLCASWAAATYPLLSIMRPGVFPIWFTLASIPIGFLLAYAGLWLLLTMLRLQSKLLSGRRSAESDS